MRKLLTANLFRLRISRIFHIELIAVCLLGVIEVIIAAIQHRTHLSFGTAIHLDSVLFGHTLFIGVFMAVFCSLFMGTEYSDGTLRNKIISGHLRRDIYFANLITNIVAALLLCAAYILVVIVIGTPLIGFVTQELQFTLLKMLGTIALTVSFCSIFTLISMLLQDKTIVAIVEILVIVVFPIIAFVLNDYPEWLSEAKGISFYIGTFFHSVLPMGQSIQYADVDYTTLSAVHIGNMIIYSLLISVLSTVFGWCKFTGKELK